MHEKPHRNQQKQPGPEKSHRHPQNHELNNLVVLGHYVLIGFVYIAKVSQHFGLVVLFFMSVLDTLVPLCSPSLLSEFLWHLAYMSSSRESNFLIFFKFVKLKYC